uniref:Uncharacterized protein n=1 Tax=CrAss-like virus sp. ctyM420 TaxID=2828014 RepID=A0A8S5TJH1_9CAUD|nr:MAG TPA: hypothetical protein [CrAss-like virus sp. ctyM420]
MKIKWLQNLEGYAKTFTKERNYLIINEIREKYIISNQKNHTKTHIK